MSDDKTQAPEEQTEEKPTNDPVIEEGDADESVEVEASEELVEEVAKAVANRVSQKSFTLFPNVQNQDIRHDRQIAEANGKWFKAAYFGNENEAQKFIKLERELQGKAGNPHAIKTLNEGTGAEGGFLVPIEFETRIFQAMDEYNEIAQDADSVTMSSNTRRLNELTGRPTAFKVDELGVITESQTTYGEPILTAEKYAGSVTFSEEVIEDAELDIVNNAADALGRSIAELLQQNHITSAVSGSEGLLVASGVTTVGQVTAGGAGTLSWDDLMNMENALFLAAGTNPAQVSKRERERGMFYMSSTAWNSLVQSKAVGNGQYFYPPMTGMPNNVQPGAYMTPWGRPVRILNEMPSPVASGTKYVIFSQLSEHFVLGRRRDLRMKINTSGISQSGVNLNIQDARELVATTRIAQVTVNAPGIVTLVSQ